MATSSVSEHDVLKTHERLVKAIARRFQGRGVDLDDLEQEAKLALLLAARTWDPAKASLATHAARRIEWRLCRVIRQAAQPAHEDLSLHEERPSPTPSAEEVLLYQEARADMTRQISELPHRERQIVRSLLAGKTVTELSEELGVGKPAISEISSRAQSRMKKHYATRRGEAA